MLTEITPNKTSLVGWIILQAVFLAALSYFIYIIIYPKGIHRFHEQRIRDWCYGALFFILNAGFFLQLYFTPFWVTIDDEFKTLEIKYLMLKPKVVGVLDIDAYSTTVIKSRSTSYFGMFLYLSDGSKILFSDLSLENYTPVETFLDGLNVKKLGEEKYSMFFFMRIPKIGG